MSKEKEMKDVKEVGAKFKAMPDSELERRLGFLYFIGFDMSGERYYDREMNSINNELIRRWGL